MADLTSYYVKMKSKRIKVSEITDEEFNKMANKHRIKSLIKYINKHYLKNPEFKDIAREDLQMIVSKELLRGLDEEFSILRDDPNDPHILKLINDKTVEIIKELYK